jgi:ribonuclease P protein component
MRLRPGQHLRRQSDIRDTRQKGARLDCRAFTIWHLEGSIETPARRGCFVASTQAVGHAVLRNRAKRRLREIFRRHQELLPKSCDLLIVARAQVNTWDLAQLERVFAEACVRMQAAAPRS